MMQTLPQNVWFKIKESHALNLIGKIARNKGKKREL